MKWQKIPTNEKEVIIYLDSEDYTLNIYTAKASVYNRLLKKIGEPTKMGINNNLIYNAEWILDANDREKAAKILSITTILNNPKRH